MLFRSTLRFISTVFAVVACWQSAFAQDEPQRVFHETIHRGAIYALSFTTKDGAICSCGNDKRVIVTALPRDAHRVTNAEQDLRKAWIAELEDPKYSVRQHAYEQLFQCGGEVIPLLKEHQGKATRRESRDRIKSLLKQFTYKPKPVHTRDIRGIAIAPSGKRFWTAARDNSICEWALPTGQPIGKKSCHAEGVWSIACSANNRWLATGGGDYMIRLWNAQTGEKLRFLQGHQKTVKAVTFSPDNTMLASAGGFGKTIRIWDPELGSAITTIDDSREAVSRLAFSPDSKSLISAGYGNNVLVHETTNWKVTQQFETGISVIRGLTVSHDGRWLAVAGNHDKIELWNLETRKRRSFYSGFSGTVESLAFAHRTNALAAGDSGGSVSVWKLPQSAE